MSEFYSDEDLEIAEDKRLHWLGIDPSGDPMDILIQLRKKREEMERAAQERRKSQKPSAG